MFKIETIPKCPEKILQCYQAGEILGIDISKSIEVKTKEKSFITSFYPFVQTDHLFNQLIGKPITENMILGEVRIEFEIFR